MVKSGTPLPFSQQEAFLASHLKTMAEVGYGYGRQGAINPASDYLVCLGLDMETINLLKSGFTIFFSGDLS